MSKPGKVLRVDTVTWKYIDKNRKPKETISALVRRLMGLDPKKGERDLSGVYYILPESRIVCFSIEEARGEAIMRAIRKGKKKPTERPIEVRVVG